MFTKKLGGHFLFVSMKRQLSDSEESPVKRPAAEIAGKSEEENGSSWLKTPGATTSGTLFGNFGTFSFGSIKPKDNPFGEKPSDNPWAEPAPALGDDTKKDRYAQVELKQQTVQTGEENESTLFTSRARLYALSFADTASGWKERGVGVLKVNADDSNRARIVMRSEGLLRVVLNMPLAKNTQIGKGFESSLVTEKFVQIVGIEKDVPHKYALKLPSKELALELYDILDARPETVVEPEKPKKVSPAPETSKSEDKASETQAEAGPEAEEEAEAEAEDDDKAEAAAEAEEASQEAEAEEEDSPEDEAEDEAEAEEEEASLEAEEAEAEANVAEEEIPANAEGAEAVTVEETVEEVAPVEETETSASVDAES